MIPLVATAALVAAACSSESESPSGDDSSAGDSEEVVIGVSVPLLTSPFWEQFSTITEEQIAAQGLTGLAIANADSDQGTQLADIEALVTQGANGILFSPVDGGAVEPILTSLGEDGIPVVAVNDAPSSGTVAIVVRANNVDYAQAACERMAEEVTSGKIISIDGDQSTVAGQERASGFIDCMAEEAPDVEILTVATKWDAESAADGLQTLLSANPDVKGVYMAAGGVFLDPTLSALRAADLLHPIGDPRHVNIATIDGIELEYAAMADEFVDTIIGQPVDLYATYGLEYLVRAINGETFEVGPSDHDTEIIEDEAGNLQDVVPPVVVTPENLADFYTG